MSKGGQLRHKRFGRRATPISGPYKWGKHHVGFMGHGTVNHIHHPRQVCPISLEYFAAVGIGRSPDCEINSAALLVCIETGGSGNSDAISKSTGMPATCSASI